MAKDRALDPDRAPGAPVERLDARAPVVELVDRVISIAISRRASDIHVEPTGTPPSKTRIRIRVDGVLTGAAELPRGLHEAFVSRLKILARLDIAVRQRPQDGGFTHPWKGSRIGVRMSTIPVQAGEKAVLRLLNPEAAPRDLASLGMHPADLERVQRTLERQEGVLMAAGPTGSGKTTTLSGAVAGLSAEQLNIVTLEDPVEYRLPGVAQMSIGRKSGLDFPVALRAALRQDPDVILVGEVRDRETAEIAMSAAVTGHVVLTTIHTVDAPSAIVRLLEMGVPAFLVAGGLAGVIAQRLVRRVCAKCGGLGCAECSGGYSGRCGVFEVLVVDDEIRTAIAQKVPITHLRRLARENGMGSMAQDAVRKLRAGITTRAETEKIVSRSRHAAAQCRSCSALLPPGAAGCPQCGAPRFKTCRCGQTVSDEWRYCPQCLRRLDP